VTTVEQGYGPADLFRGWDDDCPLHGYEDESSTIGTVSQVTYDLDGRPVTMYAPGRGTSRIEYDGFGRPIIVTDADGNQTRVGYDAAGHVRWRASFNGVPIAVGYGFPVAFDLNLLGVTEYSYDLVGRATAVDRWHFDAGSAVGDGRATTTYAYDDVHRKLTVTDDSGYVTVTTFDGAGRARRTEYPTGDVEIVDLSVDGHVVTQSHSGPTAAGTVRARTSLDAWGNPLVREVDVSGTWVTANEWQYDSWGRVSTKKGPGGLPLPPDTQRYLETLDYDGFGRLTAQTRTAPTASQEIVGFHYDRDGRMIERHSQSGPRDPDAVTSYTYDGLDRLKRVDRPGGHWDENTYDGRSMLPHTSSASGRLVQYTYHDSGRLSRILAGTGPSSWAFRDFTYDGLGQILTARDSGVGSSTTADDVVTSFRWDSLGDRVQESTVLPGTTPLTVTHQYDGRGLPVTSTLGSVNERRSYDGLGRLTDVFLGTATTPVAHFVYGGLGGPTSRSYSNGITTSYVYDSLGRLQQQLDRRGIGQTAKWQWSIPLDGVPRAATMWRGTTPTTSVYGIDGGGRVLSEDHGLASIAALGITPSTSTSTANATMASYLHTGRTSTSGGFGTGTAGSAWRDYALDGRDNWLSRTAGTSSLNVSPVHDLGDSYTSFGSTASYYADGALQSLNSQQYTYDQFGDLTDYQSGGSRNHYQYDALGRRVRVTTSSVLGSDTTAFGYDGQRRTLRKLSAETSVETMVDGAGLDEHLVRIAGNTAQTKTFYHQDRTNSVYLVTNDAGTPLEWYQYSAYGDVNILSPSGIVLNLSSIGNRFGYQGQAFDWSGLVDMRNRFYRPAWGRFVSPDPIGLAGGPNLYAFAGSAPTAFWDPLGLDRANFVPHATGMDFLRTIPDPNFTDSLLGAGLWEYRQIDQAAYTITAFPRAVLAEVGDGMATVEGWLCTDPNCLLVAAQSTDVRFDDAAALGFSGLRSWFQGFRGTAALEEGAAGTRAVRTLNQGELACVSGCGPGLEASGGPLRFAHGTSPSSAPSVMGGLDQAAAKAISGGGEAPGSFFAHPLGPPGSPGEGLQLAYEWGLRYSDNPVVLIGELQRTVVNQMLASGGLQVVPLGGVNGMPQLVFSPEAFQLFNENVKWLTTLRF
jgi:RHS repeat-associated protein